MFYLHVYIITIFHNYAFNNPFHLISSYISKHFNDFFETSFLKTCQWGFITIFVQGFDGSNRLINGGIFWYSEEIRVLGKVWRVVIDVLYSDLDNF